MPHERATLPDTSGIEFVVIRKTAIIVLGLAMSGTLVIWATSYHARLVYRRRVLEWSSVTWAHRGRAFFLVLCIPDDALHCSLGFTWDDIERSSPSVSLRCISIRGQLRLAFITFPLWVPTTVFVSCLAIAVIPEPLKRWRRRKRNCCVQCGYNLTGNVSGICPECGRPIDRVTGCEPQSPLLSALR